ncbi:hypothetical protein [Treponema sp.]|uniref:hypothetical protein n=1 Tax=Treponema sp. TaxID=166 RepID=UPI0025CD9674|nr:hypothetical protein [Treponema sp.]MCR5219166.1 hypothetical protein [Treponema sp.]
MASLKKISIFLLILIALQLAAFSASDKNNASDYFKSYPSRFQEIHSAALTDALKGNYSSAINQFLKKEKNKSDVFGILEEDASDSTKEACRPYIEQIKNHIQDYIKLLPELDAYMTNPLMQADIQKTRDLLTRLAYIRNQVYTAGDEVEKIDRSVYVRHLAKSIKGIKEVNFSGITGVMDCNFYAILNTVLGPAEKETLEQSLIISNAFLPENIFSSDEKNVKAAGKNIEKLADKCIEISELTELINIKDENYKNELLLLKNSISSVNTIAETAALISVKTNVSVSRPEDIKQALRTGNDLYSVTLVNNAATLLDLGKAASSIRTSQNISRLNAIKNKKDFSSKLVSAIISACSNIEKETVNSSIKLWIESAKYYAQAASQITEENQGTVKKLSSYLDDNALEKFAGKCITECKNALILFNSDKKILMDGIEKLNAGYGYRTNFINEQKLIEDSIKRIEGLEKELNKINSEAEEKYLKSKIAVNTVEIAYQKAQALYQRKDYIQAFNQHQKAVNLYMELESELKNDCELRNEIYLKLTQLKQEIIEGEKSVFVVEQRKYKIDARRSYDAGNFENAGFILTQAEEKRRLWAKMMDFELELDPELERLKDFVNTAIAIKEGREISRYDSKAPEILYNLSEAQKNFNQGEKLFNQGEKEKAKAYLSAAEEKIQLVKNYYPRNKDAGLLRLKIDQLTDKESFDASFPEKIKKLKQEVKSSDTSSRQAYSDLLDLYEINPDYPGLKKIITEAEYTLGFRQRPADTSQIKKAAELSSQAQEALNQAGRDEILLEHARSLANQAIALNSDDGKAITVLDEIARRKGEKPAVILSASDEELYQKALKDYQNGNLPDARIKINKLLENSSNGRSAKILKLKENIERKLNE